MIQGAVQHYDGRCGMSYWQAGQQCLPHPIRALNPQAFCPVELCAGVVLGEGGPAYVRHRVFVLYWRGWVGVEAG